ncbi:MAG: hypothetical protein RIQ93_1415, partial [Verrucomicrobiota bacterium]
MTIRIRLISVLLVAMLSGPASGAAGDTTLQPRLRRGAEAQTASWLPAQTAIIVCDMWDDHTCKGAARRVAAMAPQVDAFVAKARARGVLIVHAPSDVMKFYDGTPQRKRAQEAPAATAPVPIRARQLMPEREGALPIDDNDWCDCRPKCDINAAKANGWPWTRQIKTINIFPEDAISDKGQEIYNLFEQRGIKNVVL